MDLRADGEAGDIEGLSKELSIDREREKLSELGGIDIGWGQDSLIYVLSGAQVVVVVRKAAAVIGDVDSGRRRGRRVGHADGRDGMRTHRSGRGVEAGRANGSN